MGEVMSASNFILGVMAREAQRPTITETADVLEAMGLQAVQFNFSCLGLPTLPEVIDPALCAEIRQTFESRRLRIAALSGTFNPIHPDPQIREAGVSGVKKLCAACQGLGASLITLGAGSYDPDNMWGWHPQNSSAQARRELIETFRQIIPVAENHEVTLAFEPEITTVISTIPQSVELVEEIGSPYLRIVIDPANLFSPAMLPRMPEMLREMVTQVAPYLALAHAKDIGEADAAGRTMHPAAIGKGKLDFDLYLKLLSEVGYSGAIIMHGLKEDEMPVAKKHLEAIIDRL
jgi:sugar phosphate isomerase/epimerase